MRDEQIAALQELVEKWKNAAVWEHDEMGNTQSASTFDQCADELATLLASETGEAETAPPEPSLTVSGLDNMANVIAALQAAGYKVARPETEKAEL